MKSPFKFLDAYQKEDKDIFFGREVETEELYDRVFETNLILLYGASGTGKTSLINCGLGNKFDTADWLPLFIRRKDNIITSWYEDLSKIAVRPVADTENIRKKIRSLYLDYFKPVYLIFDQFEELFILGTKEEQDQFFDMVKELLLAGLQCKIIISMREEYIAYLSDFERVIPSLFDNRLRIEKMNLKDIRDVISGTAEAFDIEVREEEVTIDKIIENLHDKREGIDLANLQVYLDRLYRQDVKRQGGKAELITFDPELVNQTGQLEDVLSDFLDEQLAILERELEGRSVTKKGVPLDVLFALVTDNGTKQALSKEVIKENLMRRKKIRPEDVDYCIERFQEMRILRELTA